MERISTSTWLYVANKICIYTLKYRVYVYHCKVFPVLTSTRVRFCVLENSTNLFGVEFIWILNKSSPTFKVWYFISLYRETKVIHGVYSLSAVQFMVNSQGRSMTNRIMETFKENKSELLKDKSVTWTELYIFINKSQSSNKWYWRRWSWWRWGCKVGGHDDKSHFNNYSR